MLTSNFLISISKKRVKEVLKSNFLISVSKKKRMAVWVHVLIAFLEAWSFLQECRKMTIYIFNILYSKLVSKAYFQNNHLVAKAKVLTNDV